MQIFQNKRKCTYFPNYQNILSCDPKTIVLIKTVNFVCLFYFYGGKPITSLYVGFCIAQIYR